MMSTPVFQTVDPFEIIKSPSSKISEFLAEFKAELRFTKIPETSLIKFNSETLVNHPTINQLKGLLFKPITGQIYSMTYPVPVEVNDLSVDAQKSTVNFIKEKEYTVQEALDGTLLRLAYIEEQNSWILSTNGKEDARDAFWMNGKSFYELFYSAQPNFKTDLFNKNHVYLFLLCHPLNVIVVNHTVPRLYHVTTIDRTTRREVPCEIGMDHPPTLSMVIDEVQQQIHQSLSKPVGSAGYMVVMAPDEHGVIYRYRFENFNYTKARQIRGNSNNLNYLLLELLLDKDQTKLEEFLQYYPIYNSNYEQLYIRLCALITKLYQEYGVRYKKHLMIQVHPRHHRFLAEIHTQVYLAQLKGLNQTVQYQDIMNFVLTLPPAKVLYLLNYIHDLQ
jgi:hypothetical protein